MADLSQIPTDQLQAMLKQSQPVEASSSPDLSKVSTEQLQAWANQSKPAAPEQAEPSLLDNVENKVIAGTAGLKQGIVSGIGQMGDLAKNILSGVANKIYSPEVAGNIKGGLEEIGQAGGKLLDKARAFISPTDIEKQSIQQAPISYGVGNLAGQIAGQGIGGANAIAKGVVGAVSPIASKVLPLVSGSPLVRGAVEQGVTGGIMGAAFSPDNPLQGAAKGAVLGGGLGAIGGVIGHHLERAGNIVDREVANAIDIGENPSSFNTISKIQAELKSEGLSLRKVDLTKQLKETVNHQLDALRPDAFDPTRESPVNFIANKALTNFNDVVKQKDALYAPINANTAPNVPSTFLNAVKESKDSLTAGMPKQVLPENPTIQEMLNYRQALTGKISQAKAQAAVGTIDKSDLGAYYNLKSALNTDIQEAAQKQGLGEQLAKAEDFYKNNYRPFEVLDSDFNIRSNPEAMNQALSKINKALNAKRPDFVMLSQMAKTLPGDGQEMMGWGAMERALNNAITPNGIFKPENYNSALTKLKASGMFDNVMTQEQRQVATGISKLIQQAKEITPSKGAEAGMIHEALQNLMYSRPGIGLLKTIGSSKVGPETARELVQRTLTGIAASTAAAGNQPEV